VTYKIREPYKHFSDLQRMVVIVRAVLEESPTYKHMQFDEKKTMNFLYDAMHGRPGFFIRVIVDENDVIVGGIICLCEELITSTDKVAYDLTIMMDKEHRGHCITHLVEIIRLYKVWAVAQGAKVVKMGVSSGLNIDKASHFLEKLGFARIGAMHGFIVEA